MYETVCSKYSITEPAEVAFNVLHTHVRCLKAAISNQNTYKKACVRLHYKQASKDGCGHCMKNAPHICTCIYLYSKKL